MVKKMYIAEDGTQFENENEALEYERRKYPNRTIMFYGHSDDIIMVSNDEKEMDEAYFSDEIKIITSDGDLIVHPIYDGCWTFAFGIENEEPAPIREIFYSRKHGYSFGVHIKLLVGDVIQITNNIGDIRRL